MVSRSGCILLKCDRDNSNIRLLNFVLIDNFRCFWAPEMCSNSSSYFSGYASDMWAAGVCLYIFVTGKLPFFSEVPTELFEMIAEAKVPYKGLGLSNSLIDLLEKVLEKDPAKRAGVGDCLKHSFLQVARNTRIRQLSEEFAQSRNLSTAVEEDDIKKVCCNGSRIYVSHYPAYKVLTKIVLLSLGVPCRYFVCQPCNVAQKCIKTLARWISMRKRTFIQRNVHFVFVIASRVR